ncbi:MAG: tandem-95 repeat protein, partial [Verrucomicrobia bacterium]|nr:tandem-95 repeat protein [Verrucomicrobiota bacterium]
MAPTRPHPARARRPLLAALLAALALIASGAPAAVLVHEFYLPMPEAQIRQSFLSLETNVSTTIESVFSVVVAGPGTVIYYDQWEDGYETDLAHPTQGTTQIWGDGNDANGIPPGFAHDPTNGLAAGTVITLRNLVPLPRNPANLLFDGRDRIAATKALVVARAGWPTTPGPVLSGATEVLATIDYGTNYVSPVGQNMTNKLFGYVGLMIMAAEDGTSVTVDTDGSGPTAPFNITLNRGESYLVNGGVKVGGNVRSTKPVQVNLVIGHIAGRYASDWFALYPDNQWSSTYYTPVGTANNGNPTFVYAYNPNTNLINVNYTTRTGSGNFTVPSNGVTQFQMPQNSGAKFTTAGAEKFFAISTVGANPASDAAYDWGFTLLPGDGLTPEAVVGWGPGSSDLSVNGSPVWVTPTAATRVYVDYNGDRAGPLTDPQGNQYDVAYDLAALESKTVYDPDKDQTAMRLYTLDGTTIAAAWGEDPAVAAAGNPYLDMGITVLPFPVPVIKKSSVILIDSNTPGLSIGDVLEYTVSINNRGLLPLGNIPVVDSPPPQLLYLTNTTTLNGSPIADIPTGNHFPLSAPGYTIPVIQRDGMSTFKYRALVIGAGTISNTASATGYGISASDVVAQPPAGGSTLCALSFTDSGGTPVATYNAGATLYFKLTDGDKNTSSNSIQTVTAVVQNFTRGDVETITLTETGTNTGIFTLAAGLVSSIAGGLQPQDGIFNAVFGDVINVTYTDPVFGDICGSTALITAAPVTKTLYLSDPAQALDRVDPVATGDNTTAQSATLGLGGSAAPVVDQVSTNQISNAASTTFAHATGTGSNRLMVVGISINEETAATDDRATNVTYAGQALTQLGTNQLNEARVEMWALLNPQSGTNNVVVSFTRANADGAVIGVITFSNVNQTTPYGAFQSDNGNGTNASLVIASATNELVLDTVMLRSTTLNGVANTNQTERWKVPFFNSRVGAGGSTRAGAASLTNAWSGTAAADWVLAAISIKPVAGTGGTNATVFTQAPAFCKNFAMPATGNVTITNYVTILSGAMPANPAITAQLSYGGTNFLTITNPAYNSGAGTLVWNGTIASNFTVPSGQAITFALSNAQAGVTYALQYDSTNKPSKISLPTTTVIRVETLGVYSAAYPATNLTSTPPAGTTVYVRAAVSDPFGSYDVTSGNLTIDGPGTNADLSVTLTNAHVVADDGCVKTFEYAWKTTGTLGNYAVSVVAHEGTEGITDTAATAVQLTFLDLGTPSVTEFINTNGVATNSFTTNSQICVRVTDLDQNTNSAVVETLSVVITSSSGDSENLTLTETGTNTGIFTGCISSSVTNGAATNNGTLLAPAGAVLIVNYTDPNDSADHTSATASISAPVASVAVSKVLVVPADGQAGIGEPVQFTLQVINTGTTTLTNVTLTDLFPSTNLAFTTAVPSPSSTTTNTLTWTNIGPLAPGQSSNFTVNFTATGAGSPATNRAGVNAGGGTTNSTTAGIIITRSALTIVKTLLNPTNGPININSNVTFRIAITNTGTTVITTLPLEDTFSAGCFQFVSATIPPDAAGAGSLLWNDLTGAGSLAPGGTYTIDVTMKVVGGCNPADNVAHADYAVDVNSNAVPSASGSVSVVTLAAKITGAVYNDADQSGTLTTNDTGLAGVLVQLFTDPNGDGNPADGALVTQTYTLATGQYELLNLTNGAYVVVETDPFGYASSAPTNNRIAVLFTNLTTSSNNNFFDYLPNPAVYATITGTVWNDANASGSYDAGETGVAGVTLELIQDVSGNGLVETGEPVVAFTTTDANGTYTFTTVVPGAYVIRETDLTGWVSTGDVVGANDNLIGRVVAPGATSSGNDFFDFFNSPTNDPPIAYGQSLSTAEDTALPITLTSFDVDGPVTNYAIATNPTHGTLTGAGANRSYTPASNYFGPDSFTFTVNDGSLTSAVATVSINVTAVNDAPTAISQSLTNAEDTALPLALTSSDPDGPATNYTVLTVPTNGTLRVLATNGAVLYTITNAQSLGVTNGLNYLPASNYFGPDAFTFRVDDGALTSAVATITITNTPVNDGPVASNQSLTTPEDTALPLTLTGSDVDGPVTNFLIVSLPTNGVLTGSGANRTYTPNSNYFGPDAFTFTVNDGSLTSTVATVSITVTPVNDAPVLALAIPDQAGTYGTAFSYTFPTNTFTDVDAADTLTFTATNLPPGIAFTGATRTFSGTPTAAGTFTVTVTATDNGTNTLSASDDFDIVVSKVPLTVTAEDKVRGYNQANPPLTFAITGFVLSDDASVVSGAPVLSSAATN